MNIAYAIINIPGYEHLDPMFDFLVKNDGGGQELVGWFNNLPQPPQSQLKEGWSIYLSKEYKEKRALEYPPITDQLDAILKYLDTKDVPKDSDLDKIITSWKEVKEKYPKP